MNFVLTGGQGFLGSYLTEVLLENDHRVAYLVRESSTMNFTRPLVKMFSYNGINDIDLIPRLKQWQPDTFIHLGWKGVNKSDRNKEFQFSYNLPFTLGTVKLASEIGCDHWIGTGSQAEYGIDDSINCESDLCLPVSGYGKAKLAASIASVGMCQSLSLKGAWARIFSVYGPRDNDQNFIPHIINSLLAGKSPQLTKCEQIWDYLYVKDAANALLSLALNGSEGLYNVASGISVTLKDVAELIKKEMKSSIAINYGAIPYSLNQKMILKADISKIYKASGWVPTTTLANGLLDTIRHLKKIANESI